MLKFLPVVIGCLGLFGSCAAADTALVTQKQKAGYVIGVELGKQLIVSKDDLDVDAMMIGLKDMFSGTKPKLTNDEMRQAMMNYQESKKVKEQAMMERFMKQNKKDSEAFLLANKKKKGVITLPSGLQYKVLQSGKGKVSPKITDTVVTHYHGTLMNGTVFDSSYERGEAVSFPVNAVIKGWTEALTKMKVGDKWQLLIPAELAYGERGAPPSIGPNAALIFDVELLEIQ
ncbi:FKBP-type peptidyl-prolyl cis-trans isomerase [bacterium]|nr:FKBP-type peptidyl-prolyl cis-trans isomerase [bacterium]MBU1993369.1 FKBP-type peptidyl-prolyl cis-trans isomerase [bacterium]